MKSYWGSGERLKSRGGSLRMCFSQDSGELGLEAIDAECRRSLEFAIEWFAIIKSLAIENLAPGVR